MPSTRSEAVKLGARANESDPGDEKRESSKRPKLQLKQDEQSLEHVAGLGAQVATNTLIMEQVFKHLSPNFNDLRNFRQVSRIWYRETLQQWRQLAVVRISPRKNVADFFKAWVFSDYLSRMHNPSNDFYQLKQYPYRKYHLISVNFLECKLFSSNLSEENIKFKEEHKLFWQKAGSLVTHLELDHCLFSPSQQELFEKLITEKLPNLQSLVLTKNRVQDKGCLMQEYHLSLRDDVTTAALYKNQSRNTNLKRIRVGGQLPMGIAILLLSAPNVEVLEFGPSFDERNKDIFPFHMALHFAGRIRKLVDKKPFQVKTLDMMDIDFYKKPHHLAIKNFLWGHFGTTENLKFTLSNTSYLKTEDIRQMLVPTVRRFSKTLKFLTVFRPPVYKFDWEDPFPVEMKSLQELYLYGNIVKTLGFLQNMPSLKTLFIDFKCHSQEERIQEMFYKTWDRSDLEDFRTLYRPYKESGSFGHHLGTDQYVRESLERLHLNLLPHVALFPRLKEQTPNLKTLETVLGTKEFQLVCKELPNLEELVLLHGSRLDDETFTGFVNTIGQRNPNNITSMQRLKTFETKSACFQREEPHDENARLGDKAVYKGFLEMTTLQKVVICASSKMTEEAENALKQHVLLARVIRNYKGANHEKGDCCKLKSFLQILKPLH